MKKQVVFMLIMFLFCFFIPGTVRAETVNGESPFEYEIVPEEENTCRISGIRITKDEGISELKIPDTINGKTVVSIGEGARYRTNDDTSLWNVFGLHVWVVGDESYQDWECASEVQKKRALKIKKIILPDTIKVIRDYCFATLSGLKTIKLPQSLTTIGFYAFVGTPKLKDIHIPANVKEGVAGLTETGFPWKSFTISKENPYYKVKKGLLYSKDAKVLYGIVLPKKNIRIPDSVGTIEQNAFYDIPLQSLYLGAGVKKIKYNALSTKTSCRITISPSNPYLVRSGMCIYRKKKREMLVGIPKKRILKISHKVKKMGTYGISIVGIGKKYKVKKIYCSNNIKKILPYWSLGRLVHKHCRYITVRN